MPLPIITAKTPRPPRILLYGPAGIGKTTLACTFPGVLLLPVEEGADAFDVPRLPTPKTWSEAIALLSAVRDEPTGYQALAIDSLTALESLACRHVCEDHGVPTIEEIPYGKGYPLVAALWSHLFELLEHIRTKGLAVVMVGHLEIKRYDDPRTAGYDRFQPRLHKSILPMTVERCDALLCANYKVFTDTEDRGFNKERVRAIGNSERALFTTEQPTHLAKNRYGLPPELPMSWSGVLAGIAATFKPSAAVSNPQAASAA